MYWPLNNGRDDRRKDDESGTTESVWSKRTESRTNEPLRRRQRHTPAESPESKRGSNLVPGSD